ncbi:MAG: DUF4062 domain-containing protein [bacterium]|nr:DUF4062 domain-containing protein [bacterium]
MKVFVSSTYEDLKEYRKKAVGVLNHYKCTPLAMEFFGSRTQDAETVCEDEIQECDIFIGIYAHRYGYVPKRRKKSITRREYELAKKEGKTCLCFIVKKGHPWNPDFIEMDKYPQLSAFLETLKKDRVIYFFTTPDDFAAKLAVSLANAVKEPDPAARPEEAACKIPASPQSYLAHPYALPVHFTGRETEMTMLSNWFHNENETLLVMEAIGGMGKSALSWVWLHEAWQLFYDRINQPTYYQLAAYHLRIELLQPLFPGGGSDNGLPRLEKESGQAWTLNTLANAYALSGQPAKAVPLFLQNIGLSEKNSDKTNITIGLGNVAHQQFIIGQLSASTVHLRKRITLCREIKDEFREAIGHQELGRVLAFQGKIKGAEEEFSRAFEIDDKRDDFHALSLISAYRSLSALLQARQGKERRAGEALEQARRALEFAEKPPSWVLPCANTFKRRRPTPWMFRNYPISIPPPIRAFIPASQNTIC